MGASDDSLKKGMPTLASFARKYFGKWPGALFTLAAALGLWLLLSAKTQQGAIKAINNDLITINSYKAGQIAAWRENHYRDTVLLSLHPFFGGIVSQEILSPGSKRAQLKTWLDDRLIQKRDASLAFLTPKGAVIAATTGYSAGVEKSFTEAFARAAQEGAPLMTDLYLAADGRPRITKFSPMSAAGGRGGKVLCVLAINIDPETEFYPLLKATPLFFTAAETLLVRKEGAEVLYLNELSYIKDSALKLRHPLSDANLPAAKAVNEGYSGFFAGTDYRGVKVFSAIKHVEGSNWSVITQLDRSRVIAPVKTTEYLELALILLTAGLLYGGFYIILSFREKVAQKIIQESEELLSATLRSIGDGVITTDAKGLVTNLNSVAEHLTGWTAAEAKGRPVMEIFRIINSETRDAAPNPVERALREKIAVGLENHTMLITRGGAQYMISDSCAPIHDESGVVFGAVLVFRDVTEEYLWNERLRQREAKYRGLFDESRDAIMMVKPPSWDFTAANAATIEMFRAKDESEFMGYAPGNLSPERQPDGRLSSEKSKEFMEKAMREGSSLFEWTHKRISGEEFPATVLLSKIGRDKNAFLQAPVRDITENKRLETALAESKALIDAVVEHIPLMIFLKEAKDLKFVLFNHAGEELLGYDRKDLLGKNNLDLFPPEQAAYFMAKDREVLDGKADMLDIPEEPIMTANGNRLLHTRKVCIRGADGTTKYLLGISEDITEHKKNEGLILSMNEQLQTILNATPTLIFYKDMENRFIRANKAFANMSGIPIKELEGKSLWDIYPREIAELYWQDDKAVIASGKPKLNIIESMQTPTGLRWMQTDKIPFRDSAGAIAGIVGFTTDITDRKLAETYTEMSREILQILHEPADLQSSIRRVIAALKERTGFDSVGIRLQDGEDFPYFSQDGFSEDFLRTENTLLARDAEGKVCGDKDGKVILECTCGLVLSGRTDPANPLFTRNGSFWTNDSMLLLDLPPGKDPRHNPRNKCMHQGYTSMALVPIRSGDKIIGLLHFDDRRKGILTVDIIERLEGIAAHIGTALLRKNAEESLRESELLQRILLANLPTGVVIVDPVTRVIERANDYVAELFGGPVDQLIGHRCHSLLCPADEGACPVCDLEKTVDNSEREMVRSDGSRLAVLKTVKKIHLNGQEKLLECFVDISSRKKAEAALRKSEEQVRVLLNSIGESIYGIDLQGNCTFANPVCIKTLGYANQGELLGKNMHQLIHHSYADGRPMPVEVCRIFQAFHANKATHIDDEVLWKADGTCFPAEYWSHPQSENGTVRGAVVTFIDITKRKKTEEALRQTAVRLTLATRAGGVGVWDYDVINNTLAWDDSMYKIYGITKDTFGGAYESWRAGLHPEDQARGDAEIQLALRGEKDFDTVFRVVWPDSSVHEVRALGIVQRDDSGKPLRMLGTNWDITVQKQLEQTVKETAEIRSKFASMVSHELRSPLTAITLGISLILEDAVGLSEEHKSLLELAHDNASRLGRLINAVLDFQKIAAGKMPFDIHENDITDLLTTTARSMALLAGNKGLALAADLAPDLPLALFDRDKITQVLTNLLSNAIAHTEKGSITVHAGREDDKLHISVQDTGRGIKAEDLPKLFQAFEQLGSGGDRQKGGTGLGLAISKEIILAHDGHIWAESEPGKGSIFHFTLPAKRGGN